MSILHQEIGPNSLWLWLRGQTWFVLILKTEEKRWLNDGSSFFYNRQPKNKSYLNSPDSSRRQEGTDRGCFSRTLTSRFIYAFHQQNNINMTCTLVTLLVYMYCLHLLICFTARQPVLFLFCWMFRHARNKSAFYLLKVFTAVENNPHPGFILEIITKISL